MKAYTQTYKYTRTHTHSPRHNLYLFYLTLRLMAHIYKIFFKLFYLRNSWLTIFHSLAVLAHKTLWMWEAVVETDTLHCEVRRVIHDDDHSSLEIITTHWKLLDDWTELVISQLLSLKMPLIRALYSQKLVALYKYDPTDVVLYLNFLLPFTFLKASSTKRLPIFFIRN